MLEPVKNRASHLGLVTSSILGMCWIPTVSLTNVFFDTHQLPPSSKYNIASCCRTNSSINLFSTNKYGIQQMEWLLQRKKLEN